MLTSVPQTPACHPVTMTGVKAVVTQAPDAAPSPSCTPTGGAATLPRRSEPPGSVCGIAPSTCEAGAVCVPGGNSGDRVCLVADGDVPCPSEGPYVERHVYADEVRDERTCSGCACGVATSATDCGGTIWLYMDGNCQEEADSFTVSPMEVCELTTANNVGSVKYEPSRPGSCNVTSEAVPAGGLLLIGRRTLCCRTL